MKLLRNLVILLLLAAVLTIPVVAASGKASMDPQVIHTEAGKTFTVTVRLEDVGKINIGTVALVYDARVFTLLGGKCLIGDTMFAQVVQDKSAGTFLLSAPKNVSGDIFTFEFIVNAAAASGQYSLEMKASVGVGKGEYITATGTTVMVGSAPAGTTPQPTVPQAPDAADGKLTEGTEGTTPAVPTAPAVDQDATVQETQERIEQSLQPIDPDGPVTKHEFPVPEGEEPFPWWILGVVAAAAAVIVLVVVLKKRSGKEDEA